MQRFGSGGEGLKQHSWACRTVYLDDVLAPAEEELEEELE
jgi:hypothetical protein